MRSISVLAVIITVVLVGLLSGESQADINSEMETLGCVCGLILLPVCGSDNVTYPNDCILRCAMKTPTGIKIALHKIHDEACEFNYESLK
uniref:Salivary Kazal 1 n=1 Tax=Ochlerotatus triseriatus TaxID=7162 RepID=C6ZQX8_OCHTR